MKEIYKSALWALISIPITWFGLLISFALAHGSAPFLIPLFFPGLVVLEIFGNENNPSWLLATIGFTAQYIGYFLVIYGIRLLVGKFKKRNKAINKDAH